MSQFAMPVSAALLFLTGCSGVTQVCDQEGTCLETWRNVSAVSTVTVSQLRAPGGKPEPGSIVSSIGGGVASYFDPLASDLSTTATEAKVVRSW